MSESNVMNKIMPTTTTAVEPVSSAKELKIGQILVRQGRMNPGQVDLVLKEQENTKLRFGEVATSLGSCVRRISRMRWHSSTATRTW